MKELERILAKQAHERTKAEIAYLHAHKDELSQEQVEQLKNETLTIISRVDNKITVKKEGEDTVMFSRPLTITDTSEQLNGTKYDISSMAVDSYKGLITIDHGFSVKDIVGKVINLQKQKNKVTIDGIKFAINENAEAVLAMNMLLAGFITDFSIETIGPWPDDDNVYRNSKLVGLSMVIVGNNTSATTNGLAAVAINSLNQARSLGLDTTKLELGIDKIEKTDNNEIDMLIRVTNTRAFDITVKFKNDKGEEQTKVLKANEFVDVLESEANSVTEQIKNAAEPKKEVDVAEIVKNAVEAATKPLHDKIAELDQKIFDNDAREPEFRQTNGGQGAGQGVKYADMPYKQRHALQIEAAWDLLKSKDFSKANILNEINKVNLEALQKAGKVDNTITIADMGNFVISPELLTDIEGHRSNYQPLLSVVNYQETLSLQMAWLERNGDIEMDEVEECDDDADGNLKPVKEYSATMRQSNLHEIAAVTPVCDAATRFLAVDLLGDIAQGFRTAYDRKKAQLLIARLQQAVDHTGNKLPYNGTSDLTTLKSWADMFAEVSERVPGGLAILNDKSRWELVKRALGAGISGPLAALLMTGDLSPIFGKNYVVVPNDLMPSLNSAETKSFTVEGVSVTINQGVFFFEPTTFAGRISGGLKYDFSTEAAYEVGDEVRSAYQRNELVVRGSAFRGGAIKDREKVASLFAAGVS